MMVTAEHLEADYMLLMVETRADGLLVFTRTPQGYNLRLASGSVPGPVVLKLSRDGVACLPQTAERLQRVLVPGADARAFISAMRRAQASVLADLSCDCDLMRELGGLLLRPRGARIEVLTDAGTVLGTLTRRGGQRRRGTAAADRALWEHMLRQLRGDENLFCFALEPLGLRGSCGGWDFELSARGLRVREYGEALPACTLRGQRLDDGCHPSCTLSRAQASELSPAAARFARELIHNAQLRSYLALPQPPCRRSGLPAEPLAAEAMSVPLPDPAAAGVRTPQPAAEAVLMPVCGRVQELVAQLDQAIVGQQEAKVALATACYMRELRLRTPEREHIRVPSLLLQGPTGCGKTGLVSRLATLGSCPFVRAVITDFTNEGYNGRNLEEICDELLDSAMHLNASQLPRPRSEDESLLSRQVRACEQNGIVFIDELDKLCPTGNEQQEAYLRSMQHELLNLISGKRLKLQEHTAGNDKKPVMMETAGMLFICAGAFEDHGPDELCTELRGRLGQPVCMRGLTRADFMAILTHERCSPLRTLRSLARAAGLELDITPEAVATLAELADARRHYGARALLDMIARLEQAVLSGRLRGPHIGAEEVRACVCGSGERADSAVLPQPAVPQAGDVIAHLDRHIRGQAQAKQVLATAYVTRLLRPQAARRGAYTPQHVLLQGPTGCGKSSLVRELAEFGTCPLACADLSNFTPAGVSGANLSSILDRLYDQALELVRHHAPELPADVTALDTERQSAVRLCERYGIIFLDEFDKLCADGGTGSGRRLQFELLNFIEGRCQPLERRSGLSLDTAHMLFICAGAFESCRVSDLCSELRGRLVHRARLHALSCEDIMAILTSPHGSPLAELQQLLRAAGHDIILEHSGVKQIAQLAARNLQYGGRVLRSICARLQQAVLCGELQAGRLDAAGVKRVLHDLGHQDGGTAERQTIGFVSGRRA